ncbi:hypothetical protein HKX48_000323 [Thoreauomyces humboldtii]|nr:hypothetical protein HKX48_000323 [Thoreauomyces humboldtii]
MIIDSLFGCPIEADEAEFQIALPVSRAASDVLKQRMVQAFEQMSPPSNWPPEIVYIVENLFSPTVPYELHYACVHNDPDSDHSEAEDDSSHHQPPIRHVTRRTDDLPPYEIRIITTPGHPAIGELGLFATRRIEPFRHICDYIGLVRPTSEIPPSLPYTLGFHGPLSIDASETGNEARCINDWNGIVERPNAHFDVYRDGGTGRLCAGVWSLNTGVDMGQEIVVPYGGEFWGGGQRWLDEWDEGEEEVLAERGRRDEDAERREREKGRPDGTHD